MAKYGHWTTGQLEALMNTLGEENALALLRGEKAVEFRDVISALFDRNGRRIPRNLENAVRDANPDFRLEQPAITYGERLARIGEHLQITMTVSAAEFEDRCQKLLERLSKDEQSGNVVNGIHLPICIPQTIISDYGQTLDEVYLEAVGRSYEAQFRGRNFNNYRKGNLAKQVTIVPGATRHEQLVTAMSKSPVLGIYFPNPLQGFSVHAQREQMSTLPEIFLLSGGFDTATAMVAYPDVMARDFNTPGLDMVALQWQGPSRSLCLVARDDRLLFSGGADLGLASVYFSGGLFVLG